MTDRHKGYVVTLDSPTREDDAQAIIDAIRMVRGVSSVAPLIDDGSSQCDRQMVRTKFCEKLLEFVRSEL